MGRLSKVIDFHGDPPRGSGYYPPDVVMISASSRQKPLPDGFNVVHGTITHLLREKPLPMRALLAKLGYCGLNPLTDRTYTHADRAFILGVSMTQYKNALQAAYGHFRESYKMFSAYEAGKISCP